MAIAQDEEAGVVAEADCERECGQMLRRNARPKLATIGLRMCCGELPENV